MMVSQQKHLKLKSKENKDWKKKKTEYPKDMSQLQKL